jgi:hypothetical protein
MFSVYTKNPPIETPASGLPCAPRRHTQSGLQSVPSGLKKALCIRGWQPASAGQPVSYTLRVSVLPPTQTCLRRWRAERRSGSITALWGFAFAIRSALAHQWVPMRSTPAYPKRSSLRTLGSEKGALHTRLATCQRRPAGFTYAPRPPAGFTYAPRWHPEMEFCFAKLPSSTQLSRKFARKLVCASLGAEQLLVR